MVGAGELQRPARRLFGGRAGLVYLRLGALEGLAYRTDYFFSILYTLIQVGLLALVWRAFYAYRPTAGGVDLTTMIAYVTLVSVQDGVIARLPINRLAQQIRDGRVGSALCRPLSMPGQEFWTQLGRAAALLPFALAALPPAVLLGGMVRPASPVAAVAYLISFLLGVLLAIAAATLVGLVAFWVLEIRGILDIYQHVRLFFSGALVPVWIMPGWLAPMVRVLPFQGMSYTPAAVYLGELSGYHLLSALAVQLGWLLVLVCLLRLTWRRAVHKIVVQGG